METRILYLGDTSLTEAASYLAGVMRLSGISFDYLPSSSRFESALVGSGRSALVLSDYSASNFAGGELERIAGLVKQGMGLLMIGGWESYCGLGGGYPGTALAEALPVEMQLSDDRVNCSQPCLIEKKCEHPILDGLPFDNLCPGIGGFNRVEAKSSGLELLGARQFTVRREGGEFKFTPAARGVPLLVVGNFGEGRVAAFTTDVAPHWIGGLVDWGDKRVTACAPGAREVEVGELYARFFSQLLRWVARI